MYKSRSFSTIAISLFSSWLLSFLFMGQALYSIIDKFIINVQALSILSVTANLSGLFLCGFFIKTLRHAKYTMLFSIAFSVLLVIPLFFPPSSLWYAVVLIGSFAAGLCVASWGFFFKFYTPVNERMKTAADVLIYSNIMMILTNVTSKHLSYYAGLASVLILLTGAMYFLIRLPENAEGIEAKIKKEVKNKSLIKPLALLCFFIIFININSGLMYQVINPAFEHLEWLVSWYWAIPYVIAIYIVKALPYKVNRNYILYVAIAFIGLSFIAFMSLDRSAGSYFIINTLMMGACGVYDLFWWSILGETLEFHDNPAKLFGIGLSSNVFGILLGSYIGNIIDNVNIRYGTSIIALIVVFASLLILPFLHKHLSLLLKSHVFLSTLYQMAPADQEKTISNIFTNGKLTKREYQIVALLLKGRTYKMIADELYLSENTVKTHIKSIYSKYQVNSKTELMNLIAKKE